MGAARWSAGAPHQRFLLALWLAMLIALAGLAFAARGSSALPGDLGLTRELQENRPLDGALKSAMVGVSIFGYWPWAELIVVVPAVILLLMCRRGAALFLLIVTLADVLSAGFKLAVERPRPRASQVEVYQHLGGYSFPSGHVVHYVVIFGALAFVATLALRCEPGKWRRAAIWSLIGACGVLIALVGPSRVYLGAHWSSDVVGGYMLEFA